MILELSTNNSSKKSFVTQLYEKDEMKRLTENWRNPGGSIGKRNMLSFHGKNEALVRTDYIPVTHLNK